MVSFPLHPARAARLLLLASKMAKPRALHADHDQSTHGNRDEADEIEVSDSLRETLEHSNYYQGVYYFIRSTADEVATEIKAANIEKTKRGFILKNKEGKTLGPTGKDRKQPRWAAAHRAETLLHRAADRHVPKLSVAIRYAFAVARKAAMKQSSADKAKSVAVTVLRAELRETLPKMLRAAYHAGGTTGVELLRPALKSLGGPGSGNFGHSGRPGEIGGSGDGGGAEIHISGESITFTTPSGNIEGKLEGGTLKIRESFVKEGERGKGEGKRLYESALQYGQNKGIEVRSSEAVSVSADRVWQSLKKDGWPVERAANVELDTSLNKFYAGDTIKVGNQSIFVRNGQPIWRTTGMRRAETFRAAKNESKKPFDIDFEFDDKTQSAIYWADKHAAELIDGISEESREQISNAIAELLETGDWSEAKAEILEAVGDEDRADRIARNETMVAVHEGQREAWDQAVDAGLLDSDSEREWIVVGDEKVCPICESLEGKRAKLGETYETEDGEFEGPPAHPLCRCSEGIIAGSMESLQEFFTLGGPGSGNFGHGGRPGEVGGSSVEVDSVGETKNYSLSEKTSALRDEHDYVWDTDLLPSLDGLRPAGFSDTDSARKAGAAKKLNELAQKHGITKGFAVEIRDKDQQRVGLATVSRERVNDKDYPDFLKAAGDYMGGHGLSEKQERTLGKWLGFSKKSTDAYLKRKALRGLGGPGSGNYGHEGRPGEVGGSGDGGPTPFPEGLTKIGSAKGSNPGGTYTDKDGKKWYVKQYKNADQAANEQVANAIYRAVGVPVPVSALSEDSKQIALRWEESKGTLGQVGVSHDVADKILDGFVADVFVQNWDAVGTGHDNVIVKSSGTPLRVDQGGSLLFRAQGAPKPESSLNTINEWESLRTQNVYYNQVFKSAGVKDADALGPRAIKQIDKVIAARPSGGWKTLVEEYAPKSSEAFKSRVGQMLEARQKGLEEKRKELMSRHNAEFIALHSPGGHEHDQKSHGGDGGGEGGGKFGGKESDVTVKSKAPKAAPVPLDSKKKAYDEVKAGGKVKDVAAKYGMTFAQLNGYAYKVDKTKKEMEVKLGKKLSAEELDKIKSSFKDAPVSIGPAPIAPNVEEIAKPDAPAAPVKEWSAQTQDEQLNTALNAGLQWKEKTYGPKTGHYAWFKDGVQVSKPYATPGEVKAGLSTINYGKGVEAPKPEPVYVSAPKGTWPIDDHTVRTMGSNYPTQVENKAAPWINSLASSERTALESYTGSSYQSINSGLREGGLSAYHAKPPPELVWRGVSSHHQQEYMNNLTAGTVIEMKGFVSTSIRPEFANDWGLGKTLYEIKPAKGGYVRSISNHKQEYEYLLPHGSKYTVLGVTKAPIGSSGNYHKIIQLEQH